MSGVWSADGQRVMVGGAGLAMWDASSQQRLYKYPGHAVRFLSSLPQFARHHAQHLYPAPYAHHHHKDRQASCFHVFCSGKRFCLVSEHCLAAFSCFINLEMHTNH